MKQETVINNNERLFVIIGTGWSSFHIACNLKDLVKCCQSIEANQPYKVCHLFNGGLKTASKKYLSEILESNGMAEDAKFFRSLKSATY